MPVIIKPSPEKTGTNTDEAVSNSQELFKKTSCSWAQPGGGNSDMTIVVTEKRRILQSSFSDIDGSAQKVIPYGNGFVNGVIRAFQQDLHLILRPDDIWLAILTQFGTYINGQAEEARKFFLRREGKQRLLIDITPKSLWAMDMGEFAQKMMTLIQDNVADRNLEDWIMPNFTTTTHNDKSVAAIAVMGMIQEFFNYTVEGGCGFPSVTLLGEKSDWFEIEKGITRLHGYGSETEEWMMLLTKATRAIVQSFDSPESQATKDFWLHACHSGGQDRRCNDIETISGWLSAFCFWDKDGWIPEIHKNTEPREDRSTPFAGRKKLALNDIKYPVIARSAIPVGVLSVPVTVFQGTETQLEHETTMIAGSVAMTATTVGDETAFQPRSGWWMVEDSVKTLGSSAQANATYHTLV